LLNYLFPILCFRNFIAPSSLPQKRKQEELEKQKAAHERKMLMLAKRDPKIQRKIDKTLKVLKSSKKFYTGDKTLDENTAITLQNDQPDEDDYGYR
jgi:hypothetical protein